jgi:gliding motility-associated-like protein
MIKLIIQKKIFIYLAIIISSLYSSTAFSQCVWTQMEFEGFEYVTVCPDIIPGTIFHNTPWTNGNEHSGNSYIYMNFVNGLAPGSLVYEKLYNVCPNQEYRVSAWFQGVNGSFSNLTLNLVDGNGLIIDTWSGSSISGVWTNFISNTVNPTTTTMSFQLLSDGAPGNNDMAFDDLSLSACLSPSIDEGNIPLCGNTNSINLFDSLTTITGNTGVWSGPSALTNGNQGTFDPNVNSNGTYTYTINNGVNCPDSVAFFNLIVTSGPNLSTTAINLSCGNTIADITTSYIDNNASGGVVTYWQDASATILEPNPTNISIAGTYYIVIDAGGCADTASVLISITPGATINLGNDTSFCSGQSLILDATAGFDHYLWNDNSTNQTLTASTAGTFWAEASTLGANLVTNGNFNAGNTSFGTNYTVGTGGAWGPISNPGTYLVTTNANLAHNNFLSCTDHTSGTGNMMVVNGASIANQNVWCQTVTVTANTDYEFSTWIQNYDLPNPAELSFFINGLQIGATFSPTTAGCPWQNFFELWNSGAATSAQICIVNQSLAGGGNDFAIDDISFSPLCTATDTIIITINPGLTIDLGPDIDTCQGLSATLDATTASASYSWQDASTNPTFNATNSGIYWVDVTANGCTGRDSITVNFSNDISISDSIFNISCFGDNNGEIHLFGDTAEITIYPEADSYTYEFGATNNYGSNTTLLVNPDWPASGGTEENYTYLRYDLSSIPTGSILVGTELEMTAFRGWANGGNGNCYTQFVTDDSWQENTINYNNQPISSGTNIGFWWLWYNATPGIQVGTNSDPALNTQTATEFAGDQKISFQLHSLGYETEYFSRESPDQNQHPKLTVRYLIPYTYIWSGPNAYTSATNPITNLEAGIYNVTITNPENCTLDTFYTITEPTILTLDLDSTDASCGSNDGDVLATVTGGTQAYSYLWSTNTSAGDTNFVDNLGVDLYLLTVTDSNGCTASDSINITTNSPQTGIDTQTACSSFTWLDGLNYTANDSTATHTLTGGSVNGCDSTITLNLTITNVTNGTDVQTACNNYTWINMVNYTANNSTATHTIVAGANSGCDSIVTLDLTITNAANGIDTQSACNNYTWIDMVNYTANTSTATHLIVGGANNGCDSIVTLDLTITNAANGIDTQSACASFTWANGINYTASNSTATQTIAGGAINGCDSIVTLNLTITNAANSTDLHTACSNFTWIDGINYTASNNTAIFTITGGSTNGCDSIITLNLTITNAVNSIDIHSACANYTWIDGNNYISNNNTATFTITGGSIGGCDSIVKLNLTISPNITINLGEDLYICEETVTVSPGLGYSSYQWSDLTTNSSLTTDIYGIYSVTVTDIDGCSGSDEIELIKDCPANVWVPNVFSPNGDSKNETFNAVGDNLTGFSLKVFNRWGNLLFETNSIENGWDGTYKGSKVSSGTYVYLIDYSFTEKRNTINREIKGTVTLLK